MVELHHIYVVLFAIAAVLASVVVAVAWRHRAARGALPLAALMLGVAIWSGANAAMWYVPNLGQQVFWLRMCSVGVWIVPVGFLALAFDIAGMERWRTPGRLALISIPPFVLANIEWLNPGHLFDRGFVPEAIGPYTHYAFVPGPLYWALVAVEYAMIAVGLVIIVRVHLRSSGAKRIRTTILLLGAAVPLVATAVFQLRWNLFNDIDLGPIAFLVTGTLWLVALLRGQLLDILPLARDALVEQMSDGVVVFDGQDLVVDANPAAMELLHADATGALGKPAEAILGGVAGGFSALHGSVLGHVGEKRHAAVPIYSGHNSRYVELGVTTLAADVVGAPAHLVVLHDVTEERRSKLRLKTANRELRGRLEQIESLRDELREQAIRDPLTTLYNRRFLQDRLPREMARAERQSAPVTFLLLDIDGFKMVNDTYSHSMGDAALKMVSEVLLANARIADIVCRYGGDEFLLVMPGADADVARLRADDLRGQIERSRIVFDQSESSITVSIGVASVPDNGVTADDVIAVADNALYQAKESGRNRTVVAAA